MFPDDKDREVAAVLAVVAAVFWLVAIWTLRA